MFFSKLGNKLPKPKQKNKQNTVTAETLTDNDVYGYTGSIGPFLQKRTVISNMPGKIDVRICSSKVSVNNIKIYIQHFNFIYLISKINFNVYQGRLLKERLALTVAEILTLCISATQFVSKL